MRASHAPPHLRALPRVDEVDICVPKVLEVARRESSAMSATDGSDLRIEAVDWQTHLVTALDDLRIVFSGSGVEGQHLIVEGCEQL